jgi:hypothetical protein
MGPTADVLHPGFEQIRYLNGGEFLRLAGAKQDRQAPFLEPFALSKRCRQGNTLISIV